MNVGKIGIKLNYIKMIKFKKDDFKKWSEFRKIPKSVIEHQEYVMICNFHAEYFNHRLEEPCKCNPKRINQMIDDLDVILEHSKRKPRKKKK
jgi:hypothetical protein